MKNPNTRARSGSGVIKVPRISGRSRRVKPASCAPIMTAVSVAVAIRPKIPQPLQSTLRPIDALAKQRLLCWVGGELERPLIGDTCLVGVTDGAQQFRAGGVEEVVLVDRVGEAVE